MKLEGSPPTDTNLSGNNSQSADFELLDSSFRSHAVAQQTPRSFNPSFTSSASSSSSSSSWRNKAELDRSARPRTHHLSDAATAAAAAANRGRPSSISPRRPVAAESTNQMTALQTPPLAPSVPREQSAFRLPPISTLKQQQQTYPPAAKRKPFEHTHARSITDDDRLCLERDVYESSMIGGQTQSAYGQEEPYDSQASRRELMRSDRRTPPRAQSNEVRWSGNYGEGDRSRFDGGGATDDAHTQHRPYAGEPMSNAADREDRASKQMEDAGQRSEIERELADNAEAHFVRRSNFHHPSNPSSYTHRPFSHAQSSPPSISAQAQAQQSSSRFSPSFSSRLSPASSLPAYASSEHRSERNLPAAVLEATGAQRSSASPTRRSVIPSMQTVSHPSLHAGSAGGMQDREDEKPSFDHSSSSSEPRASSFMASLLRAAQSPDPQSPSVPSPMSVHTIVEGRRLSPERRPRKRRTSSVQEPLQGSALEAAKRAQGFPRRSEPYYHRPHTDDSIGRFSSPSFPHSHLTRGASVGVPHSPVDPSSYHSTGRHPLSSGHRWRAPEYAQAQSESGSPPYAPYPAYPPSSPSYAYQNQHQDSFHSQHGAPSMPASHRVQQQAFHTGIYGQHQRSPSNTVYSASMSSPQSAHSVHHFSRSDGPPYKHATAPHSQYGNHNHSVNQARTAMPTMKQSSSATAESAHWNSELASRARAEQEVWSRMSMIERRQQVSESIWQARQQLGSHLTYWPPPTSNLTTIRCMYANIAQKSYGSEKRFLCPPPVVKISGPLRPCKWVTMRVTQGDAAVMQSGMPGGIGSSGALGGAVAGGEEPAMLDPQGEARFGKLHVGSVSDATSKVFRLQVNLLRAETTAEDAKNGGGFRAFQEIGGPLQLPAHAWSTFHSSPINVISKPARKSVRTRAASPAIASGAIVCLYNRLNSQTVRTKYLGVEVGAVEDVAQTEVARKLVARQDGWEGFAIELLARPLHDPAVTRANARGLPSDEWGITYGSIVCLRDVNSKLCSDPMLICKVDKGRVELSSVIGNGLHGNDVVRFQIASKNREEARQILFGGARSRKPTTTTTKDPSGAQSASRSPSQRTIPPQAGLDRREGSADSNTESPYGASTTSVPDANSMLGGPVIQMQKITLMHITPTPSSRSPDEIECDLSTPRAYLCSTASENAREEPSQPALARSHARMLARSTLVRNGAEDVPLDEAASSGGGNGGETNKAHAAANTSTLSPFAEVSAQAQSASVGFSHPPAVVFDSIGSGGQVDVLEDQFCWTIVTISCTEVSYIEANAPSDGRTSYPHLPYSPLPVTPFPCLAAQPSYDPRSHSLAATVHDYLYADGLDPNRQLLNTVSAVHAVPNKVPHEVWLAHSGPLSTHASSAGPYMSDVTVSLPAMEQLLALHNEVNSAASAEMVPGRIHLPILFVRVAQGLTFPSGRWLVGERVHGSGRDQRDTLAWSFRVI